MATMSNQPLVTGVSPKEGFPGTKITIRGERLGRNHHDLIGLEICGADCLLTAEWFSPNKIVAKTLLCKGLGDIIITTSSGGRGTSTVQFKGLQEAVIGPFKESAVWVEETVSVGPRPLSMAAYAQEDPLQLSSEGNDNKYPVEELMELFPDGNGNLRSENFVPACFLLENHYMTSFEDLKYGLKFLSRKVNSQTEGKLSFLKENIGSVMEQLDALKIVKDKLDQHQEKFGTGYLAQIDESIGVCEKEAGKLFQEVLARKDRADITRNALSGFQRFRFLFSLPGTMEKSIQKGEYESAISDYSRAKTLFETPETDKPVFRKFKQQVEIRVKNLLEILKSKIVEKPPNSEEQRRLIGYLVTLECSFDPAWICISCHYDFLCNSMKNCFHQYSNIEKPKEINNYMLKTPSQKPDAQSNYPCEVQFVEAISEVFTTYFPDFWYLCLDYFNGKLPVKCEFGKQAEVKEMMTGVVKLYSKLISACIMPKVGENDDLVWNDNKSDSMSEWLPHCLSDIRDVFTDMLALDPPTVMIDILRSLLFSIRSHCLEVMVHQMSQEIAELYKEEDWSSEPNGGHGFITQLPYKYESHVINSSKVIKETLLQKYSEEKSLLKSSEVRSKLTETMGNALASFSDALEMLISQPKDRASHKIKLLPGQVVRKKGQLSGSHSAALLLILNNSSFTRDVILSQIHRSLIKLGYPDMDDSVERAKQSLRSLEALTFAKYTEMKYEPVVGQIEQCMFAGKFDWEHCPEPSTVRPYISKVLLGLIEVIAEVTSVSENLVIRVMTQVVENVCEELTRLFSCVPKFNEYGTMQAAIDVMAFQEVVGEALLNSNSRSLLKETFGLIPRFGEVSHNRKVMQILDEYRRRTRLQYQCFAIHADDEEQIII